MTTIWQEQERGGGVVRVVLTEIVIVYLTCVTAEILSLLDRSGWHVTAPIMVSLSTFPLILLCELLFTMWEGENFIALLTKIFFLLFSFHSKSEA